MNETVDEERLQTLADEMREKAVHMGLSFWDAEDLVQDTFSRFYLKRYHCRALPLRQQEVVLGQLFRAEWVKRQKDREKRKEKLVKDPAVFDFCRKSEAEESSQEAGCLHEEDMHTVLREIFRMKRTMRDVLELTALFGLRGEEAGRILGISDEVYKKRLLRARKELRARLHTQGIQF